MADRNDWDRDRGSRGRWDWDRNREFGGAERDWDRERRSADWGRGRENYGQGYGGRENFGGSENYGRDDDRPDDYQYRRSGERDDFSTRGDYGQQGSWGTFGNRPDYNRDYEWRNRGQGWGHQMDRGRNEDWGRHQDWGRNERNERYAGGTQTYGGNRDYNRGEQFERGRSESDFGGYNTGRTQLFGTGGGGFGTGFSSYGAGQFSGGAGSFSGGMGSYSDRGRFSGRGPKGWQRSDDRIREDINERLTEHPEIDASEIEVQVKSGEVTLTGTVDHRHAKRMAEDIAENISGVKDVHNNIRVQQQGQEQHAGTMATSGTGTTNKSK